MMTDIVQVFKIRMRCIDRENNIYNLEQVNSLVRCPVLMNIYREIDEEIFTILKGSLTSADLPADIQQKLDSIDQQVLKYFGATEYYYAGQRVRQRPNQSFEVCINDEYIIVNAVPSLELSIDLTGRHSHLDELIRRFSKHFIASSQGPHSVN